MYRYFFPPDTKRAVLKAYNFALLLCAPAGSAIIYSAYVFPDKWVNSFLHQCYVPMAMLNTVICTGLACYSRYGERINLAQLPADAVPILAIMVFMWEKEKSNTSRRVNTLAG